jgi:hypothetical protein
MIRRTADLPFSFWGSAFVHDGGSVAYVMNGIIKFVVYLTLCCSPALLLVPIASVDLILFSDTFLGFRLSLLRVFNTTGLESILPRLMPLLLATHAAFSFLCCSSWVDRALEFGVVDSIRLFTLDGKIFMLSITHLERFIGGPVCSWIVMVSCLVAEPRSGQRS